MKAIHMHNVKVKGYWVQKLEWYNRRTDRQTDGGDWISYSVLC